MAKKKQDVVVDDGAVYVLRAGTPVYLKTADICAMTGKSNQWIGQLVSQGTIHKRGTPHGALFDLTATMRAYCDSLEARAAAAAERAAANPVEEERQKAEAMLKKARATVAVMELEELQGKMHRSEDVAAMTEDLIYAIRGVLLALPGRLAIDAANLSDPSEVSALIRKEVNSAMGEISQYEYDPVKYEERVRERKRWEKIDRGEIVDEGD